MSRQKTSTALVILPLWLTGFAYSCQMIIISPLLPRIKEDLKIDDPVSLSWLGFIYAIMLFTVGLVSGPISDRVGRRNILLTGSAFLAIALTLHYYANTYQLLLTMRALAGAGAGFLAGATLAYIGDYFPYAERGRVTGWVMSSIATGHILGIPVGTSIAIDYGYRMTFVAFGLVLVVAWGLIWLFLPQPESARDKNPLSLWCAFQGYVQLVAKRDTGGAVLGYVLIFMSYGLFLYYLVDWLEGSIGLGPDSIPLLFLAGGVVTIVTSPISGHLSDRWGRKILILPSCIGVGIVMAITTSCVQNLAAAYIVFGIGMLLGSMRLSPLQALMTELVPDEKRGSLMSLCNSFGHLSFGAGSFIAGLTYADYGYASNTYGAAICMLLMIPIILFMLPEPEIKE